MSKRLRSLSASKMVWLGVLCAGLWVLTPIAASAAGGTVKGTVQLRNAGDAQVEDAVVSIEGLHYAADGKAPAPDQLVLDQKDLTFVPHVLPVPAGTPVTINNSDRVLHNVHSQSSLNPPFNFVMMMGKTKKVTFQKPEKINLQCDVHSEMSAVILVEDNPFFARPDSDGQFVIDGIPAGTYTIRAWHEQAGLVEQKVTVAAGQTATVNLALGK